jgi:hypothetical protein
VVATTVEGSPAANTSNGGNPSHAALESLAVVTMGQRLFLTGPGAQDPAFVTSLGQQLGSDVVCQPLEANSNSRVPAAIHGMRVAVEKRDGEKLLVLQHAPAEGVSLLDRPAPWKWISLAAVLILAWIALPYVEAWLLAPRLATRVAALKVDQKRLDLIEREFSFLRYLKQSQPPYPEALLLLSRTIAPGSQVESVTMNGRGEMALKGSMRTSQEIVDFRSKLVDSGFFSSVVVEEQSPGPNRQKVSFRISAVWKPAEARQGLEILKTEDDASAPKPPGTQSPVPTRPGPRS